MKHEKFFRTHPVFTSADLASYLESAVATGARTKESLLEYHRRSGHLIQIRRGLYAVVPSGADPASFQVDPYLVAARLSDDSILAYHTALELHGRAYSVYRQVTYLSSRPVAPLKVGSQLLRGARPPRVLVDTGQQRFGLVAQDRAGMHVHVTGFERTLVDVLDRPDLTGSWEEIWRSLELVEFFNFDTVVEYVELLNNATTAAKVGFFLEQHRETLSVDERYLSRLARLSPRQPRYLDRGKREPGRLIARWNLVVPPEVLARSWGEVL
jgi:predicted transcriptional regulator of viral defense system